MKALQRPGRTAAVVGAVVAVSATTLMALTGIASASVPGTCTDTVNIREEPSIDSRIVALCEAGTAVQTGPTRDGFVQITDLGGWAAQEYIAFDDAPPASDPTGSTPDDEDELRDPSTGPSPEPPTAEPPRREIANGNGVYFGDGADDDGADDDGAPATTSTRTAPRPAEPESSGLGGLLG